MSGHVLRIRRDTTAVLGTRTPALGEPFMNTTTGDLGLGTGANIGTDPAILLSKQTHIHNASVIDVTAAGLMQKAKVDAALLALFGLCPKILSRVTTAPPATPSVGDSYIVPTGASDAWNGQTNKIATCSAPSPSVAWAFTAPAAGQYVISDEDQKLFRYTGSAWKPAGTTSFLQSSVTPTQIVANTNNYAPAGADTAQVLRISADTARDLTGIASGVDGRLLVLQMLSGSGTITLKDESDSSSAANRFSFGSDIKLKAMEQVRLRYDGTLSRWVLMSRSYVVLTDLPQDIAFSGVVTAAPAASQNDYAPPGGGAASTFLLSPTTVLDITGLAGGRLGREIVIVNMAAATLTLKDASASSAAANRFSFGADVPLSQYQSATLRYDSGVSRWLLIASTAGAAVADGAVSPAKLSSDATGLRAKIMGASIAAAAPLVLALNPFHRLAQKNGTAVVGNIGATAGVEAYITDGWKVRAKGSLRVSGQGLAMAGLAGFVGGTQITVTTTQSSLGSGDYLQLRQSIEGRNCAQLGFGAVGANPLSLALYLLSSISGTFAVELSNAAGNRSIVKTFTLAANTWTFVSFAGAPGAGQTSFPGDTSGTWLTNNAAGLNLSITLAAGSALQGTADAWQGAEIMATSAQTNLAATSNATFTVVLAAPLAGTETCDLANAPFIGRTWAEELMRAQRYWFKTYDYDVAPGTAGNLAGSVSWTGSAVAGYAQFPLTPAMRSGPTGVVYSPDTGAAGYLWNGGDRTAIIAFAGQNGVGIANTAPTVNDVIRAHITLDAQL